MDTPYRHTRFAPCGLRTRPRWTVKHTCYKVSLWGMAAREGPLPKRPRTASRWMNQDLKKTLWAAADKLRSSMDAAEFKHIVLGLIFLKYISDAFDERRTQLLAAFNDEAGDLYLPDAADHAEALEERDYYTMANVFWGPASALWATLRAQAKLRVMVKTLLRRYKYPPNRQEEATQTVLKQAESLSADWSVA